MIKPALSTLVIFGMMSSCCYARDIDIEAFIDDASIKYETTFTINTTLELWNRILDNPVLMGKLWSLYKFSPAYKVTRKGRGFHVIDPRGLEGDVLEIQSGIYQRVYYGSGKMKNWYVPISLRGKTLFLFKHTVFQDKVAVTLNIYGEGADDIITRLLLKAFSPIICRYINKRVVQNLRDMKIIIADIMHNPDNIRISLSGGVLDDFNRLSN